MTIRARGRVTLTTLVLLASPACAPLQRAARGYADAPALELEEALAQAETVQASAWMIGQRRLLLDDFGSLDTDLLNAYGVPWKLVAAAFVMRRSERDEVPLSEGTLEVVLSEFGFLFPERIENWAGPPLPRFRRPVGLLTGTASRGFPRVELEIAGLGCSACHAGMTYDVLGQPTGEAWLGLPNTSLDVTAYGDSLFVALAAAFEQPDRLLAAVSTLYPEVSDAEMATLRRHAIPRGRKRLAELDSLYGRAIPFVNGGPGITNGVASLHHRLGVEMKEVARHAFVSIPFIGDRHLRSSLLADGVYGLTGHARFETRSPNDASPAWLDALGGAIAFFTIPTQGVSPATARRAVPAMQAVTRYLAELRPPPFPGHLDPLLAAQGEGLYRKRCSSCHGQVTPGLRDVRLVSFPNVLLLQREMGSDPARWQAADSSGFQRIRGTGFAKWVDAATTGGYVAPPLTGVWATAPYLHNGSVPTLWQLLNPELRPERFQVGGHALDYERVGIAGGMGRDGVYRYAEGYRPWSVPSLYDTSTPGRGNRGHEQQFEGLNGEQKRALIEYLKVL